MGSGEGKVAKGGEDAGRGRGEEKKIDVSRGILSRRD